MTTHRLTADHQRWKDGAVRRRMSGFTLIEMVIAILVASIISVGVISYIGGAVDGFLGAGSRNKLATSGRTVVDRVAMELHNAVPNSIRVTAALPTGDQCLEFIPFIAATTYLDPPFTGGGASSFLAIDFNPFLTLASPAGRHAMIYPISTSALYTGGNPGPRVLIDEIEDTGGNDGRVTIRLDQSHRFSRRSPVQRVFVAKTPVSFCIVDDKLFRYADYGFQSTQCSTATPACLPTTAPGRRLISDSLDNTGLSAFEILEPTLRRNAIVSIDLNFTSQGDAIRLKHEVLMRNVP